MSLVKGRGGGGVWGPPGGFGIGVGKKYSAHPLPMNKGWAFDSLLRPMRGCEFSSYKVSFPRTKREVFGGTKCHIFGFWR